MTRPRDPVPAQPALRVVAPDGAGEMPFGGERLLTAADVGAYLRLPPKKVYELPIPRVTLSARRVRFLESDVLAYVQRQRRTG